MLSDAEIDGFIHDGYKRLDGAFPRDLADGGRSILWRDTGCDENDPTTWKAVWHIDTSFPPEDGDAGRLPELACQRNVKGRALSMRFSSRISERTMLRHVFEPVRTLILRECWLRRENRANHRYYRLNRLFSTVQTKLTRPSKELSGWLSSI